MLTSCYLTYLVYDPLFSFNFKPIYIIYKNEYDLFIDFYATDIC